jgi:ubiquinone/menaquinone biosynthesis C-methylase UbiE
MPVRRREESTDTRVEQQRAQGEFRPKANDFDRAFTAIATSAGVRRVSRAALPDLPPEVEPFYFVTLDQLRHLAAAVAVEPGDVLVDLACGSGGPGLWLARATGADLVGVDFSPVAIGQAAERAKRFGPSVRARFAVGELTATGLPDAAADAVVCIDALHLAAENDAAAAAEVLRVLRPGGRLAFANWQTRSPGDPRLPSLLRDRLWPKLLASSGFVDVAVTSRPAWHQAYTRFYQVALDAGDPGDDKALSNLQHEARKWLPTTDLLERVVVIARRPNLD